MAQRLFNVVALTRTVMLSEAKHLPPGTRGRPFAGAQGDNETTLLHGRIHDVCGFHPGISLGRGIVGPEQVPARLRAFVVEWPFVGGAPREEWAALTACPPAHKMPVFSAMAPAGLAQPVARPSSLPREELRSCHCISRF
jgi:hypothetical protein